MNILELIQAQQEIMTKIFTHDVVIRELTHRINDLEEKLKDATETGNE